MIVKLTTPSASWPLALQTPGATGMWDGVQFVMITETVFSLHGVGRFLLEAVTGHDYPAAGAAFFLLSLLTVTCNLLSDLLYGLTDPRVRLERGRR